MSERSKARNPLVCDEIELAVAERLRLHWPNLAAAVIEAGSKLTRFDQIVRWLPQLTPAERARIREMLE